jgi:hypothetical protein
VHTAKFFFSKRKLSKLSKEKMFFIKSSGKLLKKQSYVSLTKKALKVPKSLNSPGELYILFSVENSVFSHRTRECW